MREILFRGKRLDNGEWVEGYYLHLGPVDLERAYIIPAYASALYTFEVDPATVGQFTGLTDQKGKQIFEGDIVQGISGGSISAVKAEIWNCSCCYSVYGFSTETTYPDIDGLIVIIGNIHDNPELLKAGDTGDKQ